MKDECHTTSCDSKQPISQDDDDSGLSSCDSEIPNLPIDRGWAWMVMLGALINTACITAFMRVFSLLFIAFIDKYQESATLTTSGFSMFSVLFAIGSFLQPVWFLPRYTVRSLTLAGSVMNVLSLVGLAFSPNILLANFLLGVNGLSCGFFMVPQMALIGRYFKKRLSLAASAATLGLSIATMGGPPLTQFFFDSYGLQGGLLLQAGLNLHCFIGSMLLRPVSYYDDDQTETVKVEVKINVSMNNSTQTLRSKDTMRFTSSDIQDGIDARSFLSLNLQQMCAPLEKCDVRSNDLSFSGSQMTVNSADKIPSVRGSLLEVNEKLFAGMSNKTLNGALILPHDRFLYKLSRSTSSRYLSNSSIILTIAKSHTNIYTTPKRQSLIIHHKQDDIISNSPNDEYLHPVPTETQIETGCCTCFNISQSTSGSSVFTNPYALMLIFASGVGLHVPAYYSYAPILGQENGLSKEQIPYLLTVAGACDLICKLGIGVIADYPRVKRIYLVMVIQLIFGVTLQFVSFFQGLTLMIVLQVIGGACAQVLFTLLPAITADILGAQYIGHIMSGYYLVNGAVTMVDHILVGLLKDMTDSFVPAFNYMGALYLFGFLLLALEPLLSRKHTK